MNTTKHSTSAQPFKVPLVDALQHVARKLDDDDKQVFADVVRQGAEAIAAFANMHNEEGGAASIGVQGRRQGALIIVYFKGSLPPWAGRIPRPRDAEAPDA